MNLNNYIPLCDAIILLMKPLVEIVIHDLESQTICYINGSLSKRKIGDASLLDLYMLKAENEIDKIVYPKLNFDGRIIRSISIFLEKKWLLCINCDVSIFNQMHSLSQSFLSNSITPQPEGLFKNDWQERLHIAIHAKLTDMGWHFDSLTGSQRKKLAYHLFLSGAFSEKNAADYIAEAISISRATIFKYLKEWRQK